MDVLMDIVGHNFCQAINNQWKSGDKSLFADLGCSLLLLLFAAMIVKFESKPSWTLKITPAVIHHCHKVGIGLFFKSHCPRICEYNCKLQN